MTSNKIPVLIWLLLAIVLAWSVRVGYWSTRQYMGDLRNRVVGARMIEDGRSPYFYKWQTGDGTRYYDPDNFDELRVSNTTSTPLFHQLFIPLAAASQERIMYAWVWLQFLFLGIMVWLSWRRTETVSQKTFVLLTTALFLLSDAWTMELTNGQVYILFPLLAMLFFQCLNTPVVPSYRLFLAGIILAIFAGIRPNAVVFFLPFVLFFLRRPLKDAIIVLIPLLLLGIWILVSPFERMLWKDYRSHLAEQVKLHQGLSPAQQNNAADPKFQQWEEIDMNKMRQHEAADPIRYRSENGNVFVLFKAITQHQLSLPALGLAMLLCIAGFAGWFFLRYRSDLPVSLPAIAVGGSVLLMIADLFSPVHRHQYYAVQWIFPLLLIATRFRTNSVWCWVVLAGLLLNCANISFIKMEHTIGEFLMLAGCFGLLLAEKPRFT